MRTTGIITARRTEKPAPKRPADSRRLPRHGTRIAVSCLQLAFAIAGNWQPPQPPRQPECRGRKIPHQRHPFDHHERGGQHGQPEQAQPLSAARRVQSDRSRKDIDLTATVRVPAIQRPAPFRLSPEKAYSLQNAIAYFKNPDIFYIHTPEYASRLVRFRRQNAVENPIRRNSGEVQITGMTQGIINI